MAGDVVATVYGPMSAKFATASLADLCLPNVGIQTGPFGSQLHASDYVEYGTPIITVEHLGENRIIHSDLPRVTDKDGKRLSRYTLITGDIVFSRVGSVDQRAIVHLAENGWLFSGRCLRVRPDLKKIDPGFLSWFFGLPTFQEHIRQIAVGATMPSLNTKVLGDVTIYYPPSLKEQQAIAHILGTLDDKIELNRKMNRTLEAMAQAIFKSWFVDFDPVRAKAAGRDTGLPKKIADLFPDSFEISELGEIPKGWRICRWGDEVTLEYGKSLRDYAAKDGPYLVYGTNGPIGRHTAALCQHSGIIIGRKGAYRGVHFSDNPFFVIDTAFYIKPKTPLNLRWAYYVLLNEDINGMDSGSAIPSTSREGFYNIPLLLPPYDLQEMFYRICSPYWHRQSANDTQSSTLIAIRNVLLPELISGKLRLTNVKPAIDEWNEEVISSP